MSKYISIIVPYVIVLFTVVFNFLDIIYKDIILSALLGVLIGIWFLSNRKTEGTKSILVILWITLLLLIVGDVVSMLYFDTVLPVLVLCSILQIFVIYMISKNKPKLTMSYKYSFKNKKRRYF